MKLGVLLIVGACLISCASHEVTEMPELVDDVVAEYKMGVGDRVSVQVWKSPELSVEVPVRPDGKISVPLVGDVIAAGKSTQQLSGQLAEAFSAYVRNPQVTVIVREPVSANFLRRVRVTGAVGQPVSIAHQQGMTVLDLVVLAGGVSEFANANAAKLYRKYGDVVKVYPIKLDDILNKGGLETNYVLSPADVITVPERLF